jgi:hypothetical protein
MLLEQKMSLALWIQVFTTKICEDIAGFGQGRNRRGEKILTGKQPIAGFGHRGAVKDSRVTLFQNSY